MIIRENKTKTKICNSETSTNLAAILKTESRHYYNHLAVNIARENEVLDQSARAIFDNHQCIFTKYICIGNHTTLSAIWNFICTSDFFKKYQNLTSPQGELNLNFLKKSRVQINFKLNEKSRMITY